MLKICKNMTREQIALALDTALLSGFVSESAVFPVASADTGTEIPADYTQLAQHFGFLNRTADSCCTGLAAVPESLFSLDMRSKKGLENIFGNGMFLQDTDGDFLPDKTDFKFILPESPDIQTVIAACNLAFRFGMETTKCSGHILADKNYCGNALIFTEKGETEITFGKTDDITRAYINGKGEELINFSALLCEKFPLCGTFDRWSDILAAMTNDFAMESADGQLAYLAAYDKNGTLYHTPDLEGWQKEHFPSAAFYNHRDGRAAYRKDYDIIWEADTFNSIMEHSVYPLINSGDTVTVKAALIENCSIRAALSAEIAKKIAAKGAVCHNI